MERSVRILLFASAREAAGRGLLLRNVPAGGIDVEVLLEALAREFPRLGRVIVVSRFVRNGEYLSRPTGRLHPGDEFAIHPPYSGG